jgi:pimeloyl-ACP methyl ester carboxylesterase
MTSLKVFVHGNPETAAIWRPLVDELSRRSVAPDDIVLLSPPGFGAPLPPDFEPTSDGYLDWLIGALDELRSEHGRSIDLVGHDWGAGHVYRLAGERPDLVRSWAADIGGLLHPDYVWHEAAKAWQTPEVGEQVIDLMVSMSRADRVATYTGLGLPESIASELADAMDADMGVAILALYRSAPESAIREFADTLRRADRSPGLIITATDDAYVSADLAHPVASELGCSELVLDGAGHWWMVSDPEPAAVALLDFWNHL